MNSVNRMAVMVSTGFARHASVVMLLGLAACAGERAAPPSAPKSTPPTEASNVVSSPHAPAAIGPYSQAIRAGELVFLSGQIPLDPKTGELVAGDVSAQTEQVLDNLAAVLDAAGCTFADVVKTTIFVADLKDFEVVNKIYGKRFTGAFPARATVQVAALPRGARVEIEAVARSAKR